MTPIRVGLVVGHTGVPVHSQLIHNKLPVKERLFRIGLNVDPYCQACPGGIFCDVALLLYLQWGSSCVGMGESKTCGYFGRGECSVLWLGVGESSFPWICWWEWSCLIGWNLCCLGVEGSLHPSEILAKCWSVLWIPTLQIQIWPARG